MEISTQEFDFLEGEVLLFDKELDWTSFDLVRKIRNHLCRAIGVKKLKVGHAGTLDPKATGLMIICTGKLTKQIDTLQAQEKEYIATIKIGATTPSYDLETQEDKFYPTNHITREFVIETIKTFIGESDQVPPLFSAIKIDGKRAYSHARRGDDVELKSRKIRIPEIELLEFSPEKVVLRIVCSKGTYIRSFARDLGLALQSGAYLIGLRRTRIGDYSIKNAYSVENFLEKLTKKETN